MEWLSNSSGEVREGRCKGETGCRNVYDTPSHFFNYFSTS